MSPGLTVHLTCCPPLRSSSSVLGLSVVVSARRRRRRGRRSSRRSCRRRGRRLRGSRRGGGGGAGAAAAAAARAAAGCCGTESVSTGRRAGRGRLRPVGRVADPARAGEDQHDHRDRLRAARPARGRSRESARRAGLGGFACARRALRLLMRPPRPPRPPRAGARPRPRPPPCQRHPRARRRAPSATRSRGRPPGRARRPGRAAPRRRPALRRPGSRKVASGISSRARATAPGWVAPTTAPATGPAMRRCARRAPRRGSRRRARAPGGRPHPGSTCARARTRAPPEAWQASANGCSESAPRYGLTVSASASGGALAARAEVGRGVGLGGRADVAALAVGDHEQSALARQLGDALGGGEAVLAHRLEERELRLDRHRVLGDGLDDAGAEALERTRESGRAVAHAAEDLARQELGPRVEPDAQHAPPLSRQPLETLPEAARHGLRLPRGSHEA